MSVSKIPLLLICVVGVSSADAQIIFEPGPLPGGRAISAALQSYLELTREQVMAIQRLNAASAQFQIEKLRRSSQVQVEIAQETAKTTLDPMALGVRYLELEAIRREVAAEHERTYAEIQKVLTDAQKTKVRALLAAMQLQPVICDARVQNILPPVPTIATRIPQPGLVGGGFASFLLGSPSLGSCSSGLFGFGESPGEQPQQVR